MTPASKEKPRRLSTAWQLSDLWGLRKGREMSLFPLCISELSGGNKGFRVPEYLPFLFLSLPLSLLFLVPFLRRGHWLPTLFFVAYSCMRVRLSTFSVCCLVERTLARGTQIRILSLTNTSVRTWAYCLISFALIFSSIHWV